MSNAWELGIVGRQSSLGVDDPPVYWWEEGKGGLEVAVVEYERFSDFLADRVGKLAAQEAGTRGYRCLR